MSKNNIVKLLGLPGSDCIISWANTHTPPNFWTSRNRNLTPGSGTELYIVVPLPSNSIIQYFCKTFSENCMTFPRGPRKYKYCIQFRERAPIIKHFTTLVLNKSKWGHWKYVDKVAKDTFLPESNITTTLQWFAKTPKIYKHLLCMQNVRAHTLKKIGMYMRLRRNNKSW